MPLDMWCQTHYSFMLNPWNKISWSQHTWTWNLMNSQNPFFTKCIPPSQWPDGIHKLLAWWHKWTYFHMEKIHSTGLFVWENLYCSIPWEYLIPAFFLLPPKLAPTYFYSSKLQIIAKQHIFWCHSASLASKEPRIMILTAPAVRSLCFKGCPIIKHVLCISFHSQLWESKSLQVKCSWPIRYAYLCLHRVP